MLSAPVNQVGAGTPTIVQAPGTTAFIRVHGYDLTAGSSGGNCVWQSSGGTPLDYAYGTGTPNGGQVVPYNPEGVFDVPAGQGLVLSTSGGTIGGSVQYSIHGAGGGTTGI